MDRIDFTNWENYFDRSRHEVVHLSDRYSETVFHCSEPTLATAAIKTITTPGLTLTELHLQSAQPFQFLDTLQKPAAESLFLLKGDVESSFAAYREPLTFSRNHQSIQYNPDFSGSHIIWSKEFHALTISYDLDYLTEVLQLGEAMSLDTFSKRIQRKQAFLSAPYAQTISSRIAEVIHNIQTCPFQGITRYIFIESKLMELFVLQMEQLHGSAQPNPPQSWSRADLEKLFAVNEFIQTSFLQPLTLKELTQKFGLNEFKLKKGYKELFQTTVFGHVHQLRMQKAKSLLKEKEMNVSDVAFFIGYDNVSSFSTEFKKRFGCTPRMVS